MPKIPINKTFKNLNGEVMTFTEGDEEEVKNKQELTLGKVLADFVLTPHQQKRGFRPLKGLELARKFYGKDAKNPKVEIDKADFIQIKELVEEKEGVYTPLIVGQVVEMLNEAEKEK